LFVFAKDFGKVGGIRKIEIHGYFVNRHRSVEQQAFGPVYFLPVDIFGKGLAGLLFEIAAEIFLAEVDAAGYIGKLKVVHIMGIYIIQRFLNGGFFFDDGWLGR